MKTPSKEALKNRLEEVEREISALEDERRSLERELFYLVNPEIIPDGYEFEFTEE